MNGFDDAAIVPGEQDLNVATGSCRARGMAPLNTEREARGDTAEKALIALDLHDGKQAAGQPP
ncbi:hypothetical protein [Psychromicrobium xiongbiense]|uniref:hypothetical protein n=1 Tax=Psychromicrobium xiongbiense TaxID=3051184 RepID=UPI0025535F95|nr:hypothetical protein [Psychromicrobium sp. YIM S02556]